MMKSLPVNFTLAEFRKVTPLDETNIWVFLLERHSDRIGVKRRDTALENLKKIFVATFTLANSVGFRAMTLRDLCRETGLSMGGLYGYIENKDQLAAIIEDVVRHISEAVPTWFAHIDAPLDRIECILRAQIYMAEILQPWLYFVFLESRGLPPAHREIAKASELGSQLTIAALIERTGTFTPDQASLLAAHCMALFEDWYVKRWKYRTTSVDIFADSVVTLLRARIGQP
ncbi:TetR/AcrR family transcriptional regulator [Undibacterium arcticum]|uniref:TetR/AcrR family transcriptional regulator n=2 Tax=Undibacterium arcticum TaxID=1762892 RepID=A0ABV7F8V1_9BURK